MRSRIASESLNAGANPKSKIQNRKSLALCSSSRVVPVRSSHATPGCSTPRSIALMGIPKPATRSPSSPPRESSSREVCITPGARSGCVCTAGKTNRSTRRSGRDRLESALRLRRDLLHLVCGRNRRSTGLQRRRRPLRLDGRPLRSLARRPVHESRPLSPTRASPATADRTDRSRRHSRPYGTRDRLPGRVASGRGDDRRQGPGWAGRDRRE